MEYLEVENKKLITINIRLEQENDDLGSEIMSLCKNKGELQGKIALLGDQVDELTEMLNRSDHRCVQIQTEYDEEKTRLLEELTNLKVCLHFFLSLRFVLKTKFFLHFSLFLVFPC